jgi:hypothetical protein
MGRKSVHKIIEPTYKLKSKVKKRQKCRFSIFSESRSIMKIIKNRNYLSNQYKKMKKWLF